MKINMMKITFISWERFNRRSELLSEQLNASLHFISFGQHGRIIQAPLRYLVQGIQTWRILALERPDIIFVQNPPIFSVLVAFLYSKRYGAHYVIDSHTGAFLSPKWRSTLRFHRVLSQQALMTIVHNAAQEKIVQQWQCCYCVLPDPLKGYPAGESFQLGTEFNIAVPSTFNEDEPLDIVFKAARSLSNVTFYLTGDAKRIPPHLLASRPSNCHLTGFMPYSQYLGLLRGADAILVLTTRDETLLCGAFEAVALGKPLIVSEWQILRDYFSIGTTYIPNTVEGVCEGVRRTQLEQTAMRKDILKLREKLIAEWDSKFEGLCRVLDTGLRGPEMAKHQG